MTHKLIKTDNYLFVMDTSKTDPLDSSKIGDPIAHLPLNGSPILEGVDLLPPYSRHQEDGIEEYAESCNQLYKEWLVIGYKSGYNKAREKYKYTEEDLIDVFNFLSFSKKSYSEFKDFIQSLSQYPTEFETEDVKDYSSTPKEGFELSSFLVPKTITTAQGIQWVGKYK